jgi:hypothetical protein
MYRRPKFLEILLEIRQEMAREADYDVDLFAEMVRAGSFSDDSLKNDLNGTAAEKRSKNQSGDRRAEPPPAEA